MLTAIRTKGLFVFLICSSLAFPGLSGCGWGGTPPDRNAIGTTPNPDFDIAVSPASLSTQAGSTAQAFVVTIKSTNGFNAAVGVAPTLPAGMVCIESPCSLTLNSGANVGTLHIAPGSIAPGMNTIVFAAVSGTLKHQASATVTVTPAPTPDFTFNVTPLSSTVVAGQSAPAYSFAVTPLNGFSGSVIVSTALPTGMTCSASPCSVTVNTSQQSPALTIAPSSTLAAGVYNLVFTADSGAVQHEVSVKLTVTAAAQADFTFAVTPLTSTIQAGTNTPSYSFTITPTNGFSSPVSIAPSMSPTGFVCQASPCNVTSSALSIANAFTFASATNLSAGSYTITFTATAGSLTHNASATVTVGITPVGTYLPCTGSAPTSSPSGSGSSFVYTGDQAPTGLAYDLLHNLVFTTNSAYNEVDVINPNIGVIVARIPVPSPYGVDVSPDGKNLFVGTKTPLLYRFDTATLCLVGTYSLPAVFPFVYYPYRPTALADGSVLIAAYNPQYSGGSLVRWNPDGTFTDLDLGFGEQVDNIVPSGDHQHAFIAGFGGHVARYDVPSETLKTWEPQFGDHTSIYAVNQDGTRVFANVDYSGPAFYDSSFNVLSRYTSSYNLGASISSPDFSHIYSYGVISTAIDVANGITGAHLGSLPYQPTYSNDVSVPFALDGLGRVLLTTSMGVMIVDVSASPVAKLANAGLRVGAYYGALSPDNPSSGLDSILNGGGFAGTPTVSFVQGGTAKQAATPAVASVNTIGLTVPKFETGCADVFLSLSNGAGGFAPAAYCYGPQVLYTEGNTGASTGGSVINIYAYGLQSLTPSVTIGGVPATVTGTRWVGISPYPLPVWIISATVPAGAVGAADITVSDATGSTTLPAAFTFVDRKVAPLPSGASPFQLVYDPKHGNLLWTDTALNQLFVYSVASGQVSQRITIGAQPRGIAITPDGLHILVLTAGDRQLTVLDAINFSHIQQAALPTAGDGVFGNIYSAGAPLYVAALSNGKAFVSTDFTNTLTTSLFVYDIGSNTFSTTPLATKINTQEISNLVATPDGQYALIDSNLYSTAQGTSTTTGLGGIGLLSALSADGSVLSDSYYVYNATGSVRGNYTGPDLVAGYGVNQIGATMRGGVLNSTGSLLYQPMSDRIRIFDASHGTLTATLRLPDTASSDPIGLSSLMAVDPAGQRLWCMTSSGVSTFSFDQDPLSIGEVQQNQGFVTLLGSGFTQGTKMQIDAYPVDLTISTTQTATAFVPTLASGLHSILLTRPDGHSYLREGAITIP